MNRRTVEKIISYYYGTFNITPELLQHKKYNETVEKIQKSFREPKNVLHNYYDLVSAELKSPIFRVKPKYKNVSMTKWTCTYRMFWPQKKEIVQEAQTKQEASRRAAVHALAWLSSIERLQQNGAPVIYSNNETLELTKKLHVLFSLSNESKLQMQSMFAQFDSVKSDLNAKISEIRNNFEIDAPIADDQLMEDFLVQGENFGSTFRTKNDLVDFYSVNNNLQLPILNYKEQFEKLVETNQIVIVKGEPGCGKSTQIPQYLLEHWVKTHGNDNCLIVVAEPRRIAAISLAERVSDERSEQTGQTAGYHVRLNSQFDPASGKILYCTNGMLLRKLQSDPELRSVSYVIIDEAHERDVNCDLLMALLLKSLRSNENLKLIVMSATINVEQFQNYYRNAPVLNVPGFQYPVKSYFLDDIPELDFTETRELCTHNATEVSANDVALLIQHIHENKPDGAILVFLPGWDEISQVKCHLEEDFKLKNCQIFCLHSRLSDKNQKMIFQALPPLTRKIILSTNIAETSVTINDIVYVIDCGIQRGKYYDPKSSLMCMNNYWISKSNVRQRAGRAGRVRSGECYHLYTSKQRDSLPDHPTPDILKVSLTKILLEAKFYSKNEKASVFVDKLLCRPSDEAVRKAIDELQRFELLDASENLTSLGKAIALYPMSPQFSKALVFSVIFNATSPILNITTIFNEDSELFTVGLLDKKCIRETKRKFSNHSDYLALSKIFEEWIALQRIANTSQTQQNSSDFCYDNFLNAKKMHTFDKLSKIHLDLLRKSINPVLEINNKFANNYELINGILLKSIGYLLQFRDVQVTKSRIKKVGIYVNRKNEKTVLLSESVNYQKKSLPSKFLIYLNETKSLTSDCLLVRNASVISPLTVLLFYPGNLVVTNDSHHQNKSRMYLEDSRMFLVGDREDFEYVLKCREAIEMFLQYFIHRLTEKDDGKNENFIDLWTNILQILNNVLIQESALK